MTLVAVLYIVSNVHDQWTNGNAPKIGLPLKVKTFFQSLVKLPYKLDIQGFLCDSDNLMYHILSVFFFFFADLNTSLNRHWSLKL